MASCLLGYVMPMDLLLLSAFRLPTWIESTDVRKPSWCKVFLPPESCGPDVCVAAGLCIAPADILFSDRTVEQV
jgi:hypothetical protein